MGKLVRHFTRQMGKEIDNHHYNENFQTMVMDVRQPDASGNYDPNGKVMDKEKIEAIPTRKGYKLVHKTKSGKKTVLGKNLRPDQCVNMMEEWENQKLAEQGRTRPGLDDLQFDHFAHLKDEMNLDNHIYAQKNQQPGAHKYFVGGHKQRQEPGFNNVGGLPPQLHGRDAKMLAGLVGVEAREIQQSGLGRQRLEGMLEFAKANKKSLNRGRLMKAGGVLAAAAGVAVLATGAVTVPVFATIAAGSYLARKGGEKADMAKFQKMNMKHTIKNGL